MGLRPGNVNQEQKVLADVDLNLLEEQRINGTVLPLNDLIKDAYDQVIRCTDRKPAVAAAEDRAIHETTRALSIFLDKPLGREFIAQLDCIYEKFGQPIRMPLLAPLLDFTNIRGQHAVVKYGGKPVGEISSARMSHNNGLRERLQR